MAGQGLKINNESSKFKKEELPDPEEFEARAKATLEGMSDRDKKIVIASRQYLDMIKERLTSANHSAQLINVEQHNRSTLVSLSSEINNDPNFTEVDRGINNLIMLLMRADNVMNYKVNDALFENSRLRKEVEALTMRVSQLEKAQAETTK